MSEIIKSDETRYKYSRMPQINFSTFLKNLPFIAIATSVLIYSSALKVSEGDYYLASEIVKNVDPKTWWISNLGVATVIAFFCLAMLLHYPIQRISRKIFKKTGKVDSLLTYTFTTFAIILFASYFNFVLNLSNFILLGIALVACYTAISVTSSIMVHGQKDGSEKAFRIIINHFPALFSLVLSVLSPYIFSDSAVIGQSCLVKQDEGKMKPVAKIIPIEISKDSLKAIYLEKPGYIKYTQIDESYVIYTYSCDKLNFSSGSSDPNATG